MSNDLLRDLQQLSGAIDRHQGGAPSSSYQSQRYNPRNTYVNPSYKPSSKTWTRPSTGPPATYPHINPQSTASTSKDVTIGGVEFKSSKNKLMRKDAPTSTQSANVAFPRPPPIRSTWNTTHHAHSKSYFPTRRGMYKPRGARAARNRVLKTTTRRTRKLDKQCPFFTKTGTCARGNKCPYQHNPDKIAICPRFLRGDCPFTSETCQLSHDSTPNRAPLCIHFANSGRCKNGDQCVYPHFKVGPRTGVCKDFAVLGYCEKGLDCDKQHLKECPAFAENGVCHIKNCKLPHVIRASATRQKKPEKPVDIPVKESKPVRYGISHTTMAPEEPGTRTAEAVQESPVAAQDADYIPLTFEESDDEDYSGSESDETEDGEDDDPPEGSTG